MSTHSSRPGRRRKLTRNSAEDVADMRDMLSALQADREVHEAAAILAVDYAEDGEPLELLHAHLDQALDFTGSPEESEQVVRIASLAWADAFVSRLNQLTCADPATGLSTAQHLITYLEGLFRIRLEDQTALTSPDLAMIVVEVSSPRAVAAMGHGRPAFGHALRLAVVADTLDSWFHGSTTVEAMLTPERVVVLTASTPDVALVADNLAGALTARLRLAPSGDSATAFVLPLPDTFEAARALLDQLRT